MKKMRAYKPVAMAPAPAKAKKHGTETPKAKSHIGYAPSSHKSKS